MHTKSSMHKIINEKMISIPGLNYDIYLGDRYINIFVDCNFFDKKNEVVNNVKNALSKINCIKYLNYGLFNTCTNGVKKYLVTYLNKDAYR